MKYDLANKDPKCAVCQSIDYEEATEMLFESLWRRYGDYWYRFDVSFARKLCINKQPMKIPYPMLCEFLKVGGITEAHVHHVDTRHPGICAVIDDAVVMIDGHHRATKCKLKRMSFFAYMLDAKESKKVIMKKSKEGGGE